MGGTYRSGNPFTPIVSSNPIITVEGNPTIRFGEPNSERLDNYFRVDFSAAYQFKIDANFKGQLNFSLLNVLDTENSLDQYYVLTQDENGEAVVNKVEQFSLGLTPNLSFQLFF